MNLYRGYLGPETWCTALMFLTAVVGLSLTGCQGEVAGQQDSHEPPAEVAHHVDEQSLNTVTLTARAEERLGIVVAEVKRVQLPRRRRVGGEVVVPPGQTIIVSAPLAGKLIAVDAARATLPGNQVERDQPIFQFTPLLTPEREVLTPADRIRVAETKANLATAQIEAERAVESAKIAVRVAQLAVDRATTLLETKAGSKRNVDEAQANLQLAEEQLQTAETRHQLLSEITLDEEAGTLSDWTIKAPVSGLIESIDAAPGETVSAGEALFRVVTLDSLWIRVPVYVGWWREIDTAAPAAVAEYGQSADAARQATYVAAPPSADPLAASLDMFYLVDNADHRLRPGQRMEVTLTLDANKAQLVVPWAAVLYDSLGGAWVYQQTAPHQFARRRVEVDYVDGDTAVLARGPEEGTRVVTDGAAELFGTEFGVGH